MKKYILIVAIAITAFNAKGQKLDKPDIDKITGDTTLRTKIQVLANPFAIIQHAITANIAKTKNFMLLYFHLQDGMDIYYSISRGDKAIIKFTDGKLLEISAAIDAHSSIISYGSPVATGCDVSYDLTDGDIETLKNNKISVIRIETTKGPFDYDIKDGKSEIIKKQLELITKK